jgi:hypothetical protein
MQSNDRTATVNTAQSPVRGVSTRLATALAALLAVNTAVQVWTMADRTVTPAHGQTRAGDVPSFPNNAETNRKIEVALTEANQRLGRIEATLSKPLAVKVTEMPPVTITNPSAAAKETPRE